MAACKLTIRLDDSQPKCGGEPISGTVTVTTEKDVTCKGLVVHTTWATHGRGNVELGNVDEKTVYEGAWQAGQSYSYPFKLKTASWPPTYDGTYLNVSHYVKAQAKLSWATDGKTEVEYRVVVEDAPDDLKPTTSTAKPMGLIAGSILGAIGMIVLVAFLPMLLVLVLVVSPFIGIGYFIKVVLPKRITGPVDFQLQTTKVKAGQELRASLNFVPARNTTINGIEWKLTCTEECASGSGSSRQTHYNSLLTETRRACGTLALRSGQKESFDFAYRLPNSSAPSLKFSDNSVKWKLEARIDIPKWPDWKKSLDVIVVPLGPVRGPSIGDAGSSRAEPPIVGMAVPGLAASAAQTATAQATTDRAAAEKLAADDAWFKQVIGQIRQSAHDDDQLALVIEAVKEFEFSVTANVEGEIDTPEFPTEEEFEYWDAAEWVFAFCPAQNCELALAWETGLPSHIKPGVTWSGQASVIGYEQDAQRLLMVVRV